MINNEALDKIIKISNLYYGEANKFLKEMLESLSHLQNSYFGESLNFINKNINVQNNDIIVIDKVLNSFSEVLKNVKISYNQQDINIVNYMRSTNSQDSREE